MTKLDEIESLLNAVGTSPRAAEEKEADFDSIDGCITGYTDYHNEAVNQGRLITMAKFRFDDDRFADYISALHEKRKSLHEGMIAKTIVLNGLCTKYGVPEIYQGKLDTVKGRSDDDTRFGVAEFAERLCYDFFRVTYETEVSKGQSTAYRQHADNIMQNAGRWGMMESMMEKTKARHAMEVPDDFTSAVNAIGGSSAPEQ